MGFTTRPLRHETQLLLPAPLRDSSEREPSGPPATVSSRRLFGATLPKRRVDRIDRCSVLQRETVLARNHRLRVMEGDSRRYGLGTRLILELFEIRRGR